MEIDLICRVCLKEGPLKSIYTTPRKTTDEKEVSFSDMLLFCASVTVAAGDGFPENICTSCSKKLITAFKFRKLCEKSFASLLLFASNSLNSNSIKKEPLDIKLEENSRGNDLDFNDETILCQEADRKEEITQKAFNLDFNDETLLPEEIHRKEEITIEDFDLDFNDKTILPQEAHRKQEITPVESQNIFRDENKFVNIDEDDGTSPNKKFDCKDILKENPKNSSLNSAKEKKKRKNNKSIKSCTYCPKIFKKPYQLLAHIDSHIGIKRYFCELCKKAYRCEKDHLKMHKRGFNFKCELCSKGFNTKTKLNIHISTHDTNREKILCGLNGCTKLFLSSGGLNRHRSLHDGLKNFICHQCSKSFIDKYLLETHLRRHSNDRTYPCNYCEKSFYQSSARIVHEKRHTNTKNYLCTECDKRFVSNVGLRRHSVCHNKEKLEACKFCAKKFSRSDNRRRHEIVMHGVCGTQEEIPKDIS